MNEKEFEIICGVLVRVSDESIEVVEEKLVDYATVMGEKLNEVYTDCMVMPLFLREADGTDDVIDILQNIQINME